MLRDTAIAWIQSNCLPEPLLRREFIRRLDAALARSVNCSYLIGRALTRIGAAYMLYPFADELFSFQLSTRQEAATGIPPGEMRSSIDFARIDEGPAPPPLLSLERLEVKTPVLRDPKQPIVCQCEYRLLRDPREALTPASQAGPYPPNWPNPYSPFPVPPHLGHQVPAAPNPFEAVPIPAHLGHQIPPYRPSPGSVGPAGHVPQPHFPFYPAGVHGALVPSFSGGSFPGRNYAFRLDYAIPNVVMHSLIAYPGQPLAPTGALNLAFLPSRDIFAVPVLAVFVRCCAVPDPNNPSSRGAPLSNPLGALLEIEKPA